MQYFEDQFPDFRRMGFNLKPGTSYSFGGVIPSIYEYVESPILGASSTSQPLYTFTNDSTTWQVSTVSVRFATASSSGTLQIEVAGAGTAVGSGTNQLTGTIALTGTANTTKNGTVIASPTTISAGSSLNVILGGTLTSLANCIVVVGLQRLS